MGLLEEFKREIESKRIFKLPDGREIKLRVITAKAMLLRTGAIPSVLTMQVEGAPGAPSEDSIDGEDLKALLRVLEAYFVLGIEEVDGDPAKICFSDAPECEGGLYFDHFVFGLAKRYGVNIIVKLLERILEVSGYPPEIASTAAKELSTQIFEGWKQNGFLGQEGEQAAGGVAEVDAPDRQGLRNDSGRAPEPIDS